MPAHRMPTRPGLSRADLHVHTTFSDGTNSPEDVLNYYALHAGVRVFAITDHDTIDGALHARRFAAEHAEIFGHLDVIVGEEVTSREGHVLGLFLDHWIAPGMSAADTVAAIHDQGGLAIAAHPYTSWMRWAGLVGVGDRIRDIPFDAIETRNANFTEVFANRRAAANAGDKACVGNSDGHFLDAVGWCFTEFPGETAADLRRALEERTTVAGGRCYGAWTLARFAWHRLLSGATIFPRRRDMRREGPGGRLEIRIHEASSLAAAVLTPVGDVDDLSGGALKETLVSLVQSRVAVILDLSEVRLLTSAGITALVAGLRQSRACGVAFWLAAPSRACVQSLTAARLLNVFPRARSVREARRRLDAASPDVVPGEPARHAV